MRPATWAAVLGVLAACGDDRAGPPDAGAGPGPDADPCAPPPPFPDGPFADPLAIPLPAGCVAGGVAGVLGRWFVASDDYTDIHGYPRFDEACGRIREHGVPESSAEGDARHDTWSDDTRVVLRDEFRTSSDRVIVDVFVACAMPDGSLAATLGFAVDDAEPDYRTLPGRRFGWGDDLASGLALVGALPVRADGTRIEAYNVAVDQGLAYVVGPLGFDVIDVADPAQPRAVGHLDGYANDVRVTRGGGRVVAYVATNASTLVIDATTPAAPTAVAELDASSHSLQLVAGGGQTRLYLADGLSSTIPVYDVTDPLVPVWIDSIQIDDRDPFAAVHDLFVDGTTIYANDTFAGTVALDVSAGLANAVELGRFQPPEGPQYNHASWATTAGGRDIVLVDDEGILGTTDGMAFVRVLDADPASPAFMTQIGRYQSRREASVHYFVTVGERAYAAYYQDGVRVADLSDPTAPVEVAHYNTWSDDGQHGGTLAGAFALRVVGDLVYVADSTAGLVILRDPALAP